MITGIITCVPHKFLFDEYGARAFLDHFYYRLNRLDSNYFLFSLSAVPKINVIHFYLLIDGRIRFRANISQITGEEIITFADGRTIHGKAWAEVTGPVIRAPRRIEMKGFRGFRYTEELFQ